MSTQEQVLDVARRARQAAAELAPLSRATKDAALHAIADALTARSTEIVEANTADVARARESGMSEYMIDRLSLSADRVTAIAEAVRHVASLPDPVGESVRGYTLPNGLELRQVRVPLGVVGIIYEGRPNVTVDAAALTLKSGNAVLLRGSSSAYDSNTALVEVMRSALTDVPADAVQLVPGRDRESVKHLMRARGLVDVLIPRGGAALINSVVEESTVPVIETGVGNCHVYVDADADVDMAVNILVNAKTQRPSVCNAAETVLVHRDIADDVPAARPGGPAREGVTVHGDARRTRVLRRRRGGDGGGLGARSTCRWTSPRRSSARWRTPWRTSGGTARPTPRRSSRRPRRAARRFVALVDSAAVMVNASTRFTDGEEFGFGAEIGISTQKLHARGPMGLPELTSTKYVVTGEGHLRGV